MSPIYPLLALAAAVTLAEARTILVALASAALGPPAAGQPPRRFTTVTALALLCSAALSASRATALVRYYGAPLLLYAQLHAELAKQLAAAPGADVTVCVGKEWYRYPGPYFLPDGASLAFVRGGFGGQLPAHFSAPIPAGSRAVRARLNPRAAAVRNRRATAAWPPCNRRVAAASPPRHRRVAAASPPRRRRRCTPTSTTSTARSRLGTCPSPPATTSSSSSFPPTELGAPSRPRGTRCTAPPSSTRRRRPRGLARSTCPSSRRERTRTRRTSCSRGAGRR